MKNLRGWMLTLGICVLSLAACDNPLDIGGIDLDGPFEQVRFSGKLENGEGLATITAFRVLLDDQPVQTSTFPEPVTTANLTGVRFVGKGQRRLKLVIDAQTVSPSLYRITSLTVEHWDAEGRLANRVELDPRTVSLATGGEIEWVFRL